MVKKQISGRRHQLGAFVLWQNGIFGVGRQRAYYPTTWIYIGSPTSIRRQAYRNGTFRKPEPVGAADLSNPHAYRYGTGKIRSERALFLPVPRSVTDEPDVAKGGGLEELFKIGDQMLPPLASPDFEDAMYQDSVMAVYRAVYAPALDKFLETRWYTVSGVDALRSDLGLLAEFVAFYRAADVHADEPSPPNLLALETRLIWGLLNMCSPPDTTSGYLNSSERDAVDTARGGNDVFTHSPRPSENTNVSADDGARDEAYDRRSQRSTASREAQPVPSGGTSQAAKNSSTLRRISIPSRRLKSLTCLLTNSPPGHSPRGRHLTTPEPEPEPNTCSPLGRLARQLQGRQDEFWSCVSAYVGAADHAAGDRERRRAVQQAGALLDGRENRDVVYTIMRLRWLQRRKGSAATAAAAAAAVAAGSEESGGGAAAADPGGDGGIGTMRGPGRERESESGAEVEKEIGFCMDVLRNEATVTGTGAGTNVVAMRVAAMATRAFSPSVFH